MNIEELEDELFRKATSDVKPIARNKYAAFRIGKPHIRSESEKTSDSLETLVSTTKSLIIRTMEDYLRSKGYKYEFEVEELDRFYYDLMPGFFRPFKDLEHQLRRRRLYPLPSYSAKAVQPKYRSPAKTGNDEQIFETAMQGVSMMDRSKYADTPEIPELPAIEPNLSSDDFESLRQLENLVRYGYGFTVSDTSEYIEGTGYEPVNPELILRLHRGDFSIQAHLDLHGMDVEQAQEAFDRFLAESVLSGKRAVLVVHGRGLSSPVRPILKSKVCEWLTRGHWRKWVIAFSSARSCDGGAGATYILLRTRPLTKRFRKKPKSI